MSCWHCPRGTTTDHILYSWQFEEAATLVRLSDKYDVPFLLELCEDLLCAEVPNMHLLGYHYGSKGESSSKPMSPIIHELWDLALWLSYAGKAHVFACFTCLNLSVNQVLLGYVYQQYAA